MSNMHREQYDHLQMKQFLYFFLFVDEVHYVDVIDILNQIFVRKANSILMQCQHDPDPIAMRLVLYCNEKKNYRKLFKMTINVN